MKENKSNPKKDKKNKENENLFENYEAISETAELGINRFKNKSERKGLKIRLISTVVLLILLFLYILSGALYTSLQKVENVNKIFIDLTAYFSFLFSGILIIGSILELNKALGIKKASLHIITIFSSLIVFLFPYDSNISSYVFYTKLDLGSWFKEYYFWLLVLAYFFEFLLIGLANKRTISIQKSSILFLMSAVIVLGYKGFTTICLNLDSENNAYYSFNTILWVWLMIIFGDTFAYIGGMRFGKTQLSPKISPKKSVEGALIGISSAFGAGLIYALCFHFLNEDFQPLALPIKYLTPSTGEWLTILMYVLLSLLFPIIGLFGDLLFSAIKRYANVKDYSNLIPGHGGILDRMDSIVFSFFILFIMTLIAQI